MVEEYNQRMSGVDLFDQKSAAYPFKHRTNKWYMVLYHCLKDIAINNSKVLFDSDHGDQKKMSAKEYRQQIIDGLLAEYTPPPPARQGRYFRRITYTKVITLTQSSSDMMYTM
mgnify:CR=1 FL=1